MFFREKKGVRSSFRVNSCNINRGSSRNNSKRGQITVFVILAIVILIGLAFLMFVKTYIEKNRSTVFAANQVRDYMNQNSMNIYVTTCLDAVTKEALIRASLQGGVFNFTNKTYGVDYLRINVTEYNRSVNVPVVVTPNNCSIVRQTPPDYPYEYTFISPPDDLLRLYNQDPLTCKYVDIYYGYSNFFGYNSLTRLCNWNGTNRVGATSTSFGLRTCERGTYNSAQTLSVQQEMEKYISEEIKKCVNFNEILNKTPSNITSVGDPQTFITFTDSGLEVKLHYPFTVVVSGRQPVSTFYDFSIFSKVRFKQIYDYSFYSIYTDITDAQFDMVVDKQVNPSLARTYAGYDIQKIESISLDHIDVIKLIDNATFIDGKPLIFQFAIKNRRPALEYIHESSASADFDIIVSENDTIVVRPIGYDPDNDDIEYNYYMWKEEYNEYFNDSDPKCISSPPNLTYIKNNCSIKTSDIPKNFTNSDRFKSTLNEAEYTTNYTDKGYHELMVYIKEKNRQGLEDWQIVRIFVFDKPKANITVNNLYDDVPDNIASIEDPYVLNGSLSVIGLSSALGNNFSFFVWNDTSDEINKAVRITAERNKSLYIPLDLNGSYSILNISPMIFSRSGKNNITLTITTHLGLSDDVLYGIEIRKCLWHRNATNFAYPYNLNPSNLDGAFYANHTCCDNSGNLFTDVNSCYSSVLYGGNSSFTNFWSRSPSPPLNPIDITYVNTVLYSDNDLFVQTFNRYCDGLRGNICAGAGVETRTAVEYCNDYNFGSGGAPAGQNRCSGPLFDFASGEFVISNTQGHCINYSVGHTFEELLKRSNNIQPSPSDFYCDATLRCSSGDGSGNYNDGTNVGYGCRGQCDIDGKCTYAVDCSCSQSCGASQFCVGHENGQPSATVCTAGSNNYEDECDSCLLNDRIVNGKFICRTGGGASGCNAAVNCDGRSPLDQGPLNNQWCDDSCQLQNCGAYVYQGNGVCRTSCADSTHCASGYSCVASACVVV